MPPIDAEDWEQKLTPHLRRWSRRQQDEATRTTVIVRLRRAVALDLAEERITAVGASVESAGPGTITAVVDASALAAIGAMDEVVAVEEPRQLFPRGPDGLSG